MKSRRLRLTGKIACAPSPAPSIIYNIYRKQGGLSLFQEPQLRPVRQPHQRLQQRPFRGRAHMLDDPLPRSLAGYAG